MVGLESRYRALLLIVMRLRTLPAVKLAIAASPRKPARLLGNGACAGAKLWQQWIGHNRRNCRKRTARHSGEREQMSVRQTLLAATILASVAFAVAPASAQTIRYANQGELKSLDPYTLNESTTHAHLGNVYEGLIARDKDLQIIPALAESWETPEPTRWRFHLRKGVKFQNADPFTADDAVLSANRVRANASTL